VPAALVRVAVLVAGYLGLSVVLWWHVWAGGHPSSTITCTCGDPAQTTWFLSWTAFALAHGHSPFFSTWIGHPGGVNLLANNSTVLIGTLVAPVTWLFGPVAAFNVAVTVVPVLDALGGFALARRFAGFGASAVGGALFGFSPWVIDSLPYGHLSTAFLLFPALSMLCLHELLVRQQGSPVRWGVALAATVVAEFFVSTEMLAAEALLAVAAVAVLVGYAAIAARTALRQHLRHAAVGIGVAAGLCLVVLAWPAWFAEAGPGHFAGAVWPFTAFFGNAWTGFFFVPANANQPSIYTSFGGYLGPLGPPQSYFGFPLLGVLAAGFIRWWRQRVVWFLTAMLLVSALLSLGESILPLGWYSTWWTPWQLFRSLPVLENIGPSRFAAFTYLFAGVLLAVVLDRTWRHAVAASHPEQGHDPRWGHMDAAGDPLVRTSEAGGPPAGALPASRPLDGANPPPDSIARRRRRRIGWAAVTVAGAVLAVVPLASTYSLVPYVTTAASQPSWFAHHARRLPAGSVLLVLPYPSGRLPQAMAWQAMDGMHYKLVGAYAKVPGPTGNVQYGGAPGSADDVLAHLTVNVGPLPAPTAENLALVRQLVLDQRVDAVVVTTATRDPQYAAGFLTAALGAAPQVSGGVWWWGDLPSSARRPPLELDPEALWNCYQPVALRPGDPMVVPNCVLAAARAGPPS